MPQGSADQRATEQAAIVKTIHKRKQTQGYPNGLVTRPKNEIEKANIRPSKGAIKSLQKFHLIERRDCPHHFKSSYLGLSQGKRNLAEYLPILTEVIHLKRQKAAALSSRYLL